MKVPDLSEVINAMNKNNYIVYDTPNRKWNVNIVGIRSSDNYSKYFDDLLFVFYRDGSEWIYHYFSITTDPSPEYLIQPLAEVYEEGTGILKEGQYVRAYEINLHRNSYEALCQNLGNVTVYRDNNYDDKMDIIEGTEDTGIFKINIHKGPKFGNDKTKNSKFSAGCQVFSNEQDFNDFLDICKNAREEFGNIFTYTLLKESDLG